MKGLILSFISFIIAFAFLSSCGKYDPITPTDEDMRVVGNIKGFQLYYDEVRCSALNSKKLMAQEYGIDWNKTDDAEKYRAELEKRVYEGLVYNYAIQLLLKDNGYTIDNETIQQAVQTEIRQLIDECGSKKEYKKYLEDNYLTDRVVRLNIAISYAINELFFLINDQGVFDEYVDFDIESVNINNKLYYSEEDFFEAYLMLLGGDIFVHSEDFFIPNETPDAEEIAKELLTEAQGGRSLKELAKENGFNYEELYHFDGELDPDFFNAIVSVGENELILLNLDSGWYVIKRLPPDEEYVYLNCYDLAYEYLFLKMNEHISEYEKTIEIELTDFGKSLDLTKIN